MRARRWMAAMVAAGCLGAAAVGVTSAGAANEWRPFGGATATGRGSYGSPWVSTNSTTPLKPSQIRLIVTGDPVRTDLDWSLTCWGSGYSYDYRSASTKVTPPYTRVWDQLPTGDPNYCELDVTAYHSKTGRLQVAPGTLSTSWAPLETFVRHLVQKTGTSCRRNAGSEPGRAEGAPMAGWGRPRFRATPGTSPPASVVGAGRRVPGATNLSHLARVCRSIG